MKTVIKHAAFQLPRKRYQIIKLKPFLERKIEMPTQSVGTLS